MKKEYEDVVSLVCGNDWAAPHRTPDDKDGALGIAMIIAFIRGVSTRLNDLAREIDVPPYVLEMAYKRLQINGLLSKRSWALTDPLLTDPNSENSMASMRAWCHVAGLASGYCGLGKTREEYQRAKKEYSSDN